MLAAVRSAAVLGIDAYDVLVEVDVALGLPMWTIVGLPAGAVKESRERVSAALLNSGFVVPARRVTVNLAPGDQRKDGKQRTENPKGPRALRDRFFQRDNVEEWKFRIDLA